MANKTISDLTEDTAPQPTDLVETVDDPAGTPTSKKATIDNVNAAFDHGCRVYHSAAQSLTNATVTPLAFNSERYDTDAYHDTSTNNSRITIPAGQGGKYIIVGNVSFDTNSTGIRFVRIVLDGSTVIGEQRIDATGNGSFPTTIAITTMYDLSATQYIELSVYQNSTGALNLNATANYSPEFMAQRLA